MNEIATRPVLRWHGGKWLLAPWIISHFPPHRVYVEPYGKPSTICSGYQRSLCRKAGSRDRNRRQYRDRTMTTFIATVRVVYVETWSVKAKDEAEARRKMSEFTEDVDDDAASGEVVDWEVYDIKISDD